MATNLPAFEHSNEFKYSRSPNPGWTFGQGVEATPIGKAWAEGEKAGWKVIDTSKEDPSQVYKILISGILPRPVAFVSSLSASGIPNLAPFSWFNQVSPKPAVLSISCSHTANGEKDTVRNIKETKGFVVNIISEAWVEQANACSIDAPSDVSEWDISGLTKADSIHVKASRVKESAFSMECELLQAIDLVDPNTQSVTTTLILGSIKYIHMRNDIVDPERGVADPAKLKPVGRMGGILYTKVGEGYILPRESWKEKGEEIKRVIEGKTRQGAY